MSDCENPLLHDGSSAGLECQFQVAVLVCLVGAHATLGPQCSLLQGCIIIDGNGLACTHGHGQF